MLKKCPNKAKYIHSVYIKKCLKLQVCLSTLMLHLLIVEIGHVYFEIILYCSLLIEQQ